MSQVALCPNCRKSIDAAQSESWCTACGTPLPDEIKSLLPKVAAQRAAVAREVPPDEAGSPVATSTSRVVNRYRDAFRVASAIVGVGSLIKVVGGILSVVIAVGSLKAANGGLGTTALVLGMALAALSGGLMWVGGVIVGAMGEMLRASLDSAVYHSPFMSAHERLDAMGLPRSIADRPSH